MADIVNPTSNVTLFGGDNPALSTAITSTSDGVKERLDVQALIDGGTFSLQPFVPNVVFDAVGYSLTTAWYAIVDITGFAGRLDFISCVVGNSLYKVRLTVDGSVIFDISMAELNKLGLTNAVNVNIWAETALKNFRYRPLTPVDFTDSLKVEVAMTTGSNTLYWLVNYRTQS